MTSSCSGKFALFYLINNYIVSSYRYVIVITKFAITKFATKRASKAQSIVMYQNKKHTKKYK